MDKITRKYGAGDPLHFVIDLTEYPGKTIGDIDDVFFSIKNKQSDADADSLLFKSQNNGGKITVTAQANPLYLDALVEWLGTEYTNMEIKKTYLGAIFIKWNGEAMADENVEDDGIYHIYIKEDFLHEN